MWFVGWLYQATMARKGICRGASLSATHAHTFCAATVASILLCIINRVSV